MDGTGYFCVNEWHDLMHRQERIRFLFAYTSQSIRSCSRDSTGQKSVEGGTEAIDIRTTTRFLAILFGRSIIEHTLLSGGVCVHVLDTTKINESRRGKGVGLWRHDVGRFDITMNQVRMLAMQVAYGVHNG